MSRLLVAFFAVAAFGQPGLAKGPAGGVSKEDLNRTFFAKLVANPRLKLAGSNENDDKCSRFRTVGELVAHFFEVAGTREFTTEVSKSCRYVNKSGTNFACLLGLSFVAPPTAPERKTHFVELRATFDAKGEISPPVQCVSAPGAYPGR